MPVYVEDLGTIVITKSVFLCVFKCVLTFFCFMTDVTVSVSDLDTVTHSLCICHLAIKVTFFVCLFVCFSLLCLFVCLFVSFLIRCEAASTGGRFHVPSLVVL